MKSWVFVITNGWDGEFYSDYSLGLFSSVALKEITCLAIDLSDSRVGGNLLLDGCHYFIFMGSSSKLNASGSHFGDFYAVENAYTVPGAVLTNYVLAAQRCDCSR